MIIKNVIVYTEDKNLQQAALLFTMTRSKAFTRQKTYRICWGKKSLTDRGHTQSRD